VKYAHYDLGHQPAGRIVDVSLAGNAANVRLLDSANLQRVPAGKTTPLPRRSRHAIFDTPSGPSRRQLERRHRSRRRATRPCELIGPYAPRPSGADPVR